MLPINQQKEIQKYFDYFNIKFTKIEIGKKPSLEFTAQYEHILPESLFYIWSKMGFASFEHGGFWLVNPIEYEDILELCLKDTEFPEYDEFYVLGRSAFGELHAIGKNTSSKLTIDLINLRIYPSIKSPQDGDKVDLLGSLLSMIVTRAKNEDIDIYDKNEKLLFERCLTNLGELKDNEIYAFEPPVVLGGPKVIENMKKVDLFQYIPFVAQLDKFQVMLDIAKEVDRLGIKPRG
ncbi:GAD-like domain-containing protein [Acinetobacter soli]|uniref:GAD-like domain-containing protein n=1 Tax=Acinetobacter soli TaxID=487316 RepID=UPI001250C8EC|nr:GAD-like domain-containing protein [Acinetobacter soli]